MPDTIVYGLVTYKNSVVGVRLSDVTYDESGSLTEAMDEDGYIEQIKAYGGKKTINFNGNVIQGGNIAALKFGATLTIDSVAYTIDKITIKETVGGNKTISGSGSAPIANPNPSPAPSPSPSPSA